jgi:alpha-tubulin suppressor-like RCC1 family protein
MKFTKYFRLLSILGFVVICNINIAQQTVILTPSKDAYLYMTLKPGYEFYANTNFGTTDKFYSGEWSASNYRVNQRSVMDFDIARIPADAVILEAKLSLYAMQPQINDDYRHVNYLIKRNALYKSNASYLERITTSWTESGVTYNTQPATSTINRVILPDAITYSQNYLDIDVTAMVKDMLNSPGGSFGIMLRLVNESKYSRMAFCSRDHTDSTRHPKLVIKYTTKDKLSTRYDHSFLLKADGNLWAWGANQYGQLGDGTTETRNTPVIIGATPDWKQVSAGFDHSMAIKDDGTLWAWGSNFYAQLGDGTKITRLSPVQIGIDSDWKKISAGRDHTLAIKTNGTLWTWGDNEYGQLGDGTTSARDIPVQIGLATNWKEIVAGYGNTLAIKTDGTLWAWGYNGNGQLGDGTNTTRYSPVQIGTDANWEKISGYSHTLAIKTDGTLWAWGWNYYGQLGDGTNINRNSPVKIDTSAKWKDISAGCGFTFALRTDSTSWAWGWNTKGQLGDGTTINKNAPIQVSGAPKCVQVVTGSSFSIILKSDNLYCGTGINTQGQLGDGTSIDKVKFNCVDLPESILKSTSELASPINYDLQQIDPSRSYLLQNYPNPTQGITTIEYYLSEDANDASIVIYNLFDVPVKLYQIPDKGNSGIEINIQDLPSGVYSYILLLNGVRADSKKLLLNN